MRGERVKGGTKKCTEDMAKDKSQSKGEKRALFALYKRNIGWASINPKR